MADIFDVTRIALPLVGMGVGATYGAPGAAVGGGIGQALASGIGLFEDQPKPPPVSGVRRQALGVQAHAMERMIGTQGLSQAQYGNIAAVVRESTMANIQGLNLLPERMSNLDRQIIQRSIRSSLEKTGVKLDEIAFKASGDAEAKRLFQVSEMAGGVNSTATSIDKQEILRDTLMRQNEMARQQMFASSIAGLTKAVVLANKGKDKDKDKVDEETIDPNGLGEGQAMGGMTV